MKLAERFCDCVKSVRKTIRLRPSSQTSKAKTPRAKESAAIGVCVKSVLQTRGRTLKKFKCRGTGKSKGPMLMTQAN
jgi:hypothetical protein